MSAPSPRATLAPQIRQPRPTPNAAATPRLAPSIAAVRSTSAVSMPGVTVTMAAAATKAMSDGTRVRALRLARAHTLLQTAGPNRSIGMDRRFLSLDPGMIEQFGDQVRPVEPECTVIQFAKPLTAGQLEQAGSLIRERPDAQLYVYGRASPDLDFLRYFPTLRRLQLSLYELEDIAGFAYVEPHLEALTFDATKKTFSLGFLARMTQLQELFLVRHKKDLSVIGGLSNLSGLGLSGITLPDLALLLPLTRLCKLKVFLGGTTDLGLLSRIPALEDLFLMRITGLSDLGGLGELAALTRLRLDWMRNVTALPSFERLTRLEDVNLDTMKGLTDLSPVAAAPGLRRLSVCS